MYNYIFALGLIFAFLDAWNIGANDVANSFATSVSSRSLTLPEAMCVATVMEFLGAVVAGSRVSETIKSKIIKPGLFEREPAVLMLGMLCALIGSSTWLTVATAFGIPVSTTHCIVGGVLGMGFATVGPSNISWKWSERGIVQVFASWVIAPGIAGAFAAAIFLVTKHCVLLRKNSLGNCFITLPIYFAGTSGILTMLIVWKGAPTLDLDSFSTGQVLGCIFGVASGAALVAICFVWPYMYRKLVLQDWTLKWYHGFYGLLLLRRGEVPEAPEGIDVTIVRDYYRGFATKEELHQTLSRHIPLGELDAAANGGVGRGTDYHDLELGRRDQGNIGMIAASESGVSLNTVEEPKRRKISEMLWAAFTHGIRQDVTNANFVRNRIDTKLAKSLWKMHARAAHYDNTTEHLFTIVQIVTAATASFAHGANDVSNAVGPLSTIYVIWNKGTLKDGNAVKVPIWVLAYGGAAIVCGLWTYGYNIMQNLGNKLTLHSPSRGFSMELGAAVTVVIATRLGLPISTTQCIVGATVGVALCNGDIKALNWRMVAWCYFGWIITLPITSVISGSLMAIIVNAPHWTGPAK